VTAFPQGSLLFLPERARERFSTTSSLGTWYFDLRRASSSLIIKAGKLRKLRQRMKVIVK